MSDILALARLTTARSSLLLKYSMVYFAVVHVFSIVIGTSFAASGISPGRTQMTAWACATCFSIPLYFLSVVMFELTDVKDVEGNQTGFSHWLLRTPVASWKLAAVPMALKTVWVFVITGGVALTGLVFDVRLNDWLVSSFALAALVLCLCVIVWKPFRWTHTRLCLLALGIVPGYAWFVAWLSYATGGLQTGAELRSLSLSPSQVSVLAAIIGIGTYVVVFLLSIRSVAIARSAAIGYTPESKLTWGFGSSLKGESRQDQVAVTVKQYRKPARSPIAAIIAYELSKLRNFGGIAAIVGWLSLLLLFGRLSNVALEAYVFSFIFFLSPGMFVCEWSRSTVDRSFLTNLLAVSPIRTATLAWTSQAIVTTIWMLSLLGAGLVALKWNVLGENNHAAATMNRFAEFHFDAAEAGGSVAMAIALLAVVMVIRQSTWSSAIAAADKKRLLLYSVAAKFFVAFLLLSWFIYHFLRFPDWQAWSVWMWDVVHRLPPVLVLCLVVKLLLVALSSRALVRSGLARHTELVMLLLGFAAATAGIGYAYWVLIPAADLHLWHCVAAAAIIVPYSRIAIAPLCLDSNRHR